MFYKLTTAWRQDLDGLIESVSKQERIVLGTSLNGYVSEENIRDEEIMARYGAEQEIKKDRWLRILSRGWIL